MAEVRQNYNPDYESTGIEGGIDSNQLPWLQLDGLGNALIKPLRASQENGMFNMVMKLPAGSPLDNVKCLGGLDLLILDGVLEYRGEGATSELIAGVWGYLPSGCLIERCVAKVDTELLVNGYGPLALLDEGGQTRGLICSEDIADVASGAGLDLIPSTLAECAQPRRVWDGPAESLAIARQHAGALITEAVSPTVLRHAYFIDCRSVPWVVNPDLPDVGLKILRVSPETGQVSLLVRHNGVATPHTHIGAGDFLILQGRLGYRAGPKEGYGPGVWIYEPAGARHDATQRVTDEDLIYTANIYGPLVFDSGPGTPVLAVLSWIEYLALAEAGGARLAPNRKVDDHSLFAAG